MNRSDSNEDCSQDDANETMGRRIEELAQAVQVLAAEVRGRASSSGRPSAPPVSSVHRTGVAELDFDAADESPAISAVEVRRVIAAIDEEAVSGRGPRADLQRAIG